jgi:hypothetical protein
MDFLPFRISCKEKGLVHIMNSRERLICSLNHQQPDKIPVDLGATAVTGISHYALHQLKAALGLSSEPVKVHDPFQILGMVEEDVLKKLDIDVVGLFGPYNFFGFKNEGWKNWKSPQGINVLVGRDFNVSLDDNGNTFMYPKGDTTIKPSAILAKDGYYFDNIVRQEEIDEDNLSGINDFKEQFLIYDDEILNNFNTKADMLYKNTEYGVILNFAGASIGDAALLPGAAIKKTHGIRKLDEWYMAHILYPNYIKEAYNFQIEVAVENLKLLKQAVGNKVQAVFISGTDFGTQRCEFMSKDMFREFYMPFYKRVNDWVHLNTSWKTFYHSCGSIINLLDDFVEMGVDIINPVQCSAAGMDAKNLKDKYGDKLVFWGGGVDTQKTLPFGTCEQVRQEVSGRLDTFGKNGGFVFNPVHNIQANTPTENIIAMFDEIKKYNSNS